MNVLKRSQDCPSPTETLQKIQTPQLPNTPRKRLAIPYGLFYRHSRGSEQKLPDGHVLKNK